MMHQKKLFKTVEYIQMKLHVHNVIKGIILRLLMNVILLHIFNIVKFIILLHL